MKQEKKCENCNIIFYWTLKPKLCWKCSNKEYYEKHKKPKKYIYKRNMIIQKTKTNFKRKLKYVFKMKIVIKKKNLIIKNIKNDFSKKLKNIFKMKKLIIKKKIIKEKKQLLNCKKCWRFVKRLILNKCNSCYRLEYRHKNLRNTKKVWKTIIGTLQEFKKIKKVNLKNKSKKLILEKIKNIQKKYLIYRKNINFELDKLENEILKSKEKREMKIIYLNENINNVLIKWFDYLSMVEYLICTKWFRKAKILWIFEKELKKYSLKIKNV